MVLRGGFRGFLLKDWWKMELNGYIQWNLSKNFGVEKVKSSLQMNFQTLSKGAYALSN